jgi:hypothetical protein
MMDQWGFSLDGDSWSSLHLNWGADGKIIHLPWAWDWYRTSYLMSDGTWLHDSAIDRRLEKNWDQYRTITERVAEDGWRYEYPYTYRLRSGEEQHVTATVTVRLWEWRRRMLRWSPSLAKKRQSIEVEFSDEVGERSGSWKGGTIGCGYDMKPGEEPLDTLRRMERERKFT